MSGQSGRIVTGLAVAVYVAVGLSFVPVSRLLHYATIEVVLAGTRLLLVAVVSLALALLHERLVRGALYGTLKEKLSPGLAAPVTAAAGALMPTVARLALLAFPTVPPLFVVLAQAYLVEVFLGLGLTWMALGAGSWVPGGIALGLLWIIRLGLVTHHHGGVVPLLELVAASAAAVAVALVLHKQLSPYRDEVMGVS